MTKPGIRIAAAVFLLAIAFLASAKLAAQKSTARSSNKVSASPASDADIKRGKYLVEEVAKCSECHTPRDAQGQLDPDRWLQGAPIWITPVKATPSWADRAPALAGFPAYSDADAVNILEKGVGANGEVIRPPMHIYHLKHEDTVAIVAYLRSLPSEPQ
ncbi:MAG: c-type cytochrome [Candidatus Acidiferrales bacterium]